MAGNAYPKLPDSRWWTLRDHFKRTMPTKVTPNLVATVLKIAPSSAGGVVAALRDLGLVDDTGAPTDLANDWRHDETYASACSQMLEATYPEELREALPSPNPDRAHVQAWFARALKTGQENARQMAALYVLIAGKNIKADVKERPLRATAPSAPKGTVANRTPDRSGANSRASHRGRESELPLPQLQVAVQVNIHPDLTPEQIDQVFRSMAEHLYAQPASA